MSLPMMKYTKTLSCVEAQVLSHRLDYLISVSSSVFISVVISISTSYIEYLLSSDPVLTHPTIRSQKKLESQC